MARVLHFNGANILRFWFSTLLFHHLYTAHAEYISQPSRSVRARLGGSVTMECYLTLRASFFTLFWIKQAPDKTTICVATGQANNHDITYCGEKNPRVKVMKTDNTFNLTLSNIKESDLATYHCGVLFLKCLFFGNGTRVILEEKNNVLSNTRIRIQQDY
ncbi:hypothetical protein MATL_G00174680 [Megalops atlanticus]|uniref:Ig-like domain-containing protein n=1 Tax=Megalops atlanticus TaxID=7932 RepID=A0A9D3PTT8_MEGAT|nr:hypothetical protein MATL_G00174680 [Megalops atlanticus]